MRFRWSCLAVAGALAAGGAAFAGTPMEEMSKHPGFVNFEALDVFSKEDAQVEIEILPNLLAMVASMSRGKDPDFAAMLGKLKGIRVQTFAVDREKLEAIERMTDQMADRLEKQGWQMMVRVRDRKDNNRTYVYMKPRGSVLEGLVVMNVDPNDEAAFINIVGEIDPEAIGKLGAKFNIDQLDSLDSEVRDKMRKHHGSSDEKKE